MKIRFVFIAVGLAWLSLGNVSRAQTAPADLSPDVQEVLTLSRQHMDDSVITNYIISTGKSYKLSADDIIYLNGQGVSQGVITALLQSSASNGNQSNAAPATPPPAAATSAADASAGSSAEPPPVDSSTPPANASSPAPAPEEPAPSAPMESPSPAPAPPQMSAMPMMPAPLADNFYMDGGLNSSFWQTQSPLLTSLAAMNGRQILPALSFSPSGMQMSGIGKKKQFMGVQSTVPYTAPFSFSATVVGMAQEAVPFEIYLVSNDLQQWLSVAGHLGGRGHPRGEVHVHFFGPFGGAGFGVPTGGPSPDYGIWVNHTGSGQPISELGDKLYPYPIAGVPYTIEISVGGDGLASVTLLDASHAFLASESVPVGTGPFYVVLAGRDGSTYAEWQSVQITPLTPAAPPEAAVEAAPAAPPTPDLGYFQQQLAPYGTWLTVPGYGLCWQPAVWPGWRPYYDGGHWEYTDAGYFWQSDYPWGDIAFHYGRWAYAGADMGWIWVPGYDYAPAWVVWRHDDDDGYVGWAPLPPGAVFVDGGWLYHGAHVGVDFDFGLGAGFFTFVGYDHFWAHDYRQWVVPHDRMVFAFHHSVFENHYAFDHGHFVNVGLGHDRMAEFTHRDFHATPMGDIRHDEEMHHAMQRQDDIHNFHAGGQPNAMGRGGEQHGGAPGGSQHQGQNNSGHQGGGNQGQGGSQHQQGNGH